MDARIMEKLWRGAISRVRAHYPEDVFPPDGKSRDCASARLVRLTLDNVIREFKRRRRLYREEKAGKEET